MNFSSDPDEFDGFGPGSVPDFGNVEEGNRGGSRSASTAGSGGSKGPGSGEDNYDNVVHGASSSKDGQGSNSSRPGSTSIGEKVKDVANKFVNNLGEGDEVGSQGIGKSLKHGTASDQAFGYGGSSSGY